MTKEIIIESAPRPVDDSPELWRLMIWNGLSDADRRLCFDADDFVECDSCAAKPGSPTLCNGCLANRLTISRLKSR